MTSIIMEFQEILFFITNTKRICKEAYEILK